MQAVPLNSEILMTFWNETAQGCQNSQDVDLLLRAHPEMARRIRATSDEILFGIPVLYSALRMGHPNVGPLEVDPLDNDAFQGGYQDYVDMERERLGNTNDPHTGEPLTAEGDPMVGWA